MSILVSIVLTILASFFSSITYALNHSVKTYWKVSSNNQSYIYIINIYSIGIYNNKDNAFDIINSNDLKSLGRKFIVLVLHYQVIRLYL